MLAVPLSRLFHAGRKTRNMPDRKGKERARFSPEAET